MKFDLIDALSMAQELVSADVQISVFSNPSVCNTPKDIIVRISDYSKEPVGHAQIVISEEDIKHDRCMEFNIRFRRALMSLEKDQ